MGAEQEIWQEIQDEIKTSFDLIKKEIAQTRTDNKSVSEKLEEKLSDTISTVTKALETKEKELHDKITDFEKRMSRKGFNFGDSKAVQTKGLGYQFTEAKEFKDALSRKRYSCDRIIIKGSIDAVKRASRIARYTKSNDLTRDELGALVQEFRWDQVIQNPLRPRLIASLIPSIPINSNAIEYPEENVVHVLYSEVVDTALVATDTTVTLERTAGFFPGQSIKIGDPTGTNEDVVVDPDRGTGLGVDEDANQLNFTPALANGYPIGTEVTSTEFVYTPQAKFKPFSRVEFVLRTANIKTLATLMNVSRQMLDDFNGLSSLIDARMTEFIELSQERQLLYGNGGAYELDGILTNPDINTYLQSAVPADTKIDALRRARTLSELSFFPTDAMVLHPLDWESIELEKDGEDRYITTQVHVSNGVTVLWQIPVLSTPVIDEGTALIGAFRMGCVRWDRQEVTIMMFDQNRDNAERNMVTLRAEMREGFSVLRPKAFVKVTFT